MQSDKHLIMRDFVNGGSSITTSNPCVHKPNYPSLSNSGLQLLYPNQKSRHTKFPPYAFRLNDDSNNKDGQKKQDLAEQVSNELLGSTARKTLQVEEIRLKHPPTYMQSETLRLIREGDIQKRWSNNNNNSKENFNNNDEDVNQLDGERHSIFPECFLCGRNIVRLPPSAAQPMKIGEPPRRLYQPDVMSIKRYDFAATTPIHPIKSRVNGHQDDKGTCLSKQKEKKVPSLEVPPSSIKKSLQSSHFLQAGGNFKSFGQKLPLQWPPPATARSRKLEKAMRYWKYYPDAGQPRSTPNAYTTLMGLIKPFQKDEQMLRRHHKPAAVTTTNLNACYTRREVATPHRLFTPTGVDQLESRELVGCTGMLDLSPAQTEQWMREDLEMARREAHHAKRNLQKSLETSISKQKEEPLPPPPPRIPQQQPLKAPNVFNNNHKKPDLDNCICEYCKQEINGSQVLAGGKKWCPQHFLCANQACAKRLLDCGFVEEGGLNYCAKCYEALLAPSCAKCTLPITKECLSALQKKWHTTCFTCTHCRKPFGGQSFFVENKLPYCERDWNQLFTTKCTHCTQPITMGDKWVEFGPDKAPFHTHCFCCKECKISLEGQSFYTRDGQPYCKVHA